MHNNFYLLRKLTKELKPLFINAVVSECFSQQKDELVLRCEQGTQSRYIRAYLQPSFSCLSFPDVFHRARKNSVDLFGEIIGSRITGILQFENERSFCLTFDSGFQLLFKMHGNRSNLALFKNEVAYSLFKNNLAADWQIRLPDLDKKLDWSYEAFANNQDNLKQLYFTFGKICWEVLAQEGFEQCTIEQKWKRVSTLKTDLENPCFYITTYKSSLCLSLLKAGTVHMVESSAVAVLNKFSSEFLQSTAFTGEKTAAVQRLNQTLAGLTSYLAKTTAKLNEVTNDQHYKTWADVLMANLHLVKPGAEHVSFPDFYNDNNLIDIKLKRDLSAQKNAEMFYRKAKNQQIEINRLQQAIEQKEKEKREAEVLLKEITETVSLKELRKFSTVLIQQKQAKEKEVPLPYHEFSYNGYSIWVGKNAQANDLLTLKFAHKEDLWLHAKDVAGSHVVVKHKGSTFPKDVIERAAQLAAYNSKRKTETLAPVAYTLKKYVRKRKGDAAGMVVVEREDVILVQPKLTTDN